MKKNCLKIIILIALFGCEGPVGPPGKNITGADVVPPTIALTEPWSHSEVWDSLRISAAAVDNVEIREVVFFIDGSSLLNSLVMVDADPPYTMRVSLSGFERGWHFVAARAYDIAGNLTDSPIVPVKVGFSHDLQDTLVTVGYNSGHIESIWQLPDSARSTAYWMRFSVARKCYLRQITLPLCGNLNDTAEVHIGVWSGNVVPAVEDTSYILYALELDDSLSERSASFGDVGFSVNRDFFVVITLAKTSEEDTIRIASDGGDPDWGRSGSRDDDGWHLISERYGMKNNFIMNCTLYYESNAEDSPVEP